MPEPGTINPNCTHDDQHWWWGEDVWICDPCALVFGVNDAEERADMERAVAIALINFLTQPEGS